MTETTVSTLSSTVSNLLNIATTSFGTLVSDPNLGLFWGAAVVCLVLGIIGVAKNTVR